MQSPLLFGGPIRTILQIATLCILALIVVPSVQAADSLYQTVDPATDCKTLSIADEEGGSASFLCKGPDDIPFIEDHGDLRSSVTYGISEEQGERVWQSFSPFNQPSETIEWRYGDRDDQPIATIRRWSVETGSGEGEQDWSILVVSRVAQDGQGACTTGYVDARRTDNVNVIARLIADAGAKNFRCWEDVPIYQPDDEELRGIVSR